MANAAVLPLEGRLETALGSGVFLAYYDPNLGITWAADADINGQDWDTANAWAAGLTLGGVSGWRLPSMDVNEDGRVVDCFGGGITGCEDNEMGFLYWEESITQLAPGPFSDVQVIYWSGTEFDSLGAWAFVFSNGFQPPDPGFKSVPLWGWAVRTGNVPAVVPIPAAVWLFGSGLMGLLGVAMRKR
jgi:hypothetical protein